MQAERLFEKKVHILDFFKSVLEIGVGNMEGVLGSRYRPHKSGEEKILRQSYISNFFQLPHIQNLEQNGKNPTAIFFRAAGVFLQLPQKP